MELAIPIVALGGMYVISNQQSSQKNKIQNQNNNNVKSNNNNQNKPSYNVNQNKENFTNMGIRTNLGVSTNNQLPNTNIQPENFPITNINELRDTVQEYPNPNVASDKYFNQNIFENRVRDGKPVGQNPQQIYSLSGDYMDSKQFNHNNMVPFNGRTVRGYNYSAGIAESQLDNMVGGGSQRIKKIEQSPLFKPEDNISWAHGTPNNTDFFLSRQNPAMRNNNVKPFDTEMVGPGINQGFSKEGTGGFNSGMEARDKWLPYTVDQLRVDTNPKLEFELTNHEGPANSYIKNSATVESLGRVEKQRPDTFFMNTQDRWLTTTGAQKASALRPIQEMGIIRSPNQETDYKGPAGNIDGKASYTKQVYENPKRNVLGECDVTPSRAVGHGPSEDGDRALDSFTNYNNNRSTIKQPDSIRSGFSSAIGAVLAPLMDVLKPTRKEELVGNTRIYGEAGTCVPSSYVVNNHDTASTTIRETTMYSPQFNINNQRESAYVNNYTAPEFTQRDTTSTSYKGGSGGAATSFGNQTYEAAYRQHNNEIKSSTIQNRTNQGGTQIFNQQMNNVQCRDDCDRFGGRMNPAFSSTNATPPSKEIYQNVKFPQKLDQNMNCERIQPDILNAFKNNPYTQSLTTSV